MIEEAAYYIARKREAAGQPGNPDQDWIEAVQQIDAQLGTDSADA